MSRLLRAVVNYCLPERKCGQMLRDMPKAKGIKGQIIGGSRGKAIITGNTSVVSPINDTKTLKEMGISLTQSSRWQKIAAIPDAV